MKLYPIADYPCSQCEWATMDAIIDKWCCRKKKCKKRTERTQVIKQIMKGKSSFKELVEPYED